MPPKRRVWLGLRVGATGARSAVWSMRIRARSAAFVRRDGVALRTSDAVNVAIAQRLGAVLLTFDKKLASNARRLGLAIA
jgi:predicted nucleic acid-binding protein